MRNYSVVIRCKNEDHVLGDTLLSLKRQTIAPSTVVLVNNNSTDNSTAIAKQHGCLIVEYPAGVTFNYSKALNMGIEAVDTPLIMLLSAHCPLATHDSAESMLAVFQLFNPVGVFGRQLPTVNSNAIDTRDLLTVFGRERVIYETHPFFHNAFSMINRRSWETTPFDESINGIEDRVWAQSVVNNGGKIVYEPSAMVFHEHGLNQGLDEARALRVCKSLYQLHKDDVFIYPHFLR
jgi:glycosyltransferase involved in cell wall biosynthesis